MEDRALIVAVRAGDRDAFGVVVRRETATVYRACLRILGSPSDAEDVTQETFMAAFRSIHGFRGEGSLRGWLLRIATRRAFRRLAQRRSEADVDAIPEPRLAAGDALDPGTAVVRDEEGAAVRAAVEAMPEPYREVVVLRFFAELSLFEIADATGRPVNTVKTHLRRGLERLRPILGAAEGGS